MTEEQLDATLTNLEANPTMAPLQALSDCINALADLVPHMEPETWGWYDLRIGSLAQARAGTRNLADHGHELDEASARLQAMFEAVSQY